MKQLELLEVFSLPSTIRTCDLRFRCCKNEDNNTKNNEIKVLGSGVAYAPRVVVQGGMPWIRLGIGRRVNGEQNLTNKSFEGYFLF